MNSEKFLSGLAFHLEVGEELNASSIPKVLKMIEKVENPNASVGEIKGMLESAKEAEYSPRLCAFTQTKIEGMMSRHGLTEEAKTDGPPALC